MYESYFEILDAVQDTGFINMFGAPKWLQENCDVNRKESFLIVASWIKYKNKEQDD
jgi:hypothetical protein